MQWARKQKGFTIVELLIVVVVIAILAAITIVAYNGIQNRAKESAAQAAASQVGKKVAQYAVLNAESYPADKAAFISYAGMAESSDTTYDYFTSTNQKNFCLTANKQSVSYSFSSLSSGTVKGKCIENLAANPSVIGSSMVYFGAAGSTQAPSTKTIAIDRPHSGTSSLKAAITGTGQASIMAKPLAQFRLNVGESLSWSFWVYSTKAGSIANIIEGYRVSDAAYTGSNIGTTIAANTWTKFSRTWSPTVDMNVSQIGFYGLSVVSGDVVWFDDATIQRGDTLYQYGDGDSDAGFWTGAAGASSSVNIVTAE